MSANDIVQKGITKLVYQAQEAVGEKELVIISRFSTTSDYLSVEYMDVEIGIYVEGYQATMRAFSGELCLSCIFDECSMDSFARCLGDIVFAYYAIQGAKDE